MPPACPNSGKGIYAIDIDSSCSRLATCSIDGSVRLWNFRVLVAEENSPDAPRLLAKLTEHSSAVNVVRFSHSGSLLASGSDDHIAMIHELRPGRGQAVFGSNEVNIENWKVIQVGFQQQGRLTESSA